MVKSNTKFLTHQDSATLNRNMILNFIKDNEPVTRTDIWEKIDLSRASVTQIIKQLMESGFVYEHGTGKSRGGRKPCYLKFNANARNILVFDWHLKTLFLTDLNSEIIYKKIVPVDSCMNPSKFIEKIDYAVHELIKTQKLDAEKIIGFGLAMPGLIDPKNGVVMLSTEQNWKNVALRDMIENVIGISTILESDSNMLALGEFMYGVGKESTDFVLLVIEDDGIGSVIILNGQLQRGSNNMSGEIGHVSLNPEGPKCSCGKNGCIEAFLKAALKKKSNNKREEVAYYIGFALSIIINVLDPKIIVLSGNVVDKMEEEFISTIRNIALENALKSENRDIRIEKSSISHFTTIKGICGMIFEKNFSILK
jgi:predicted NBD/HSP70 family sugar kinase